MKLNNVIVAVKQIELFNSELTEEQMQKDLHSVIYNGGRYQWDFLAAEIHDKTILFFDINNSTLILSPEEIKAISINSVYNASRNNNV